MIQAHNLKSKTSILFASIFFPNSVRLTKYGAIFRLLRCSICCRLLALRLEVERRGGRFWREAEDFLSLTVLYERKNLQPKLLARLDSPGITIWREPLSKLGLGVICSTHCIRFNYIELAAPVCQDNPTAIR